MSRHTLFFSVRLYVIIARRR